jgi:hypothetical protein
MKLPFTIDQFLAVIKQYNLAVWPVQVLLIILAGVIVYLITGENRNANRMVSGILGLFWIWTGVAYHLVFFTAINRAAYVFGGLFVLQGLFFLWTGVFQNRLFFGFRTDWYGITAGLFMLYALVVYPQFNQVFGHGWPVQPTFGLPCPTTIFTFGLLLMSIRKVPVYLLIIPFLWSLVGLSAASNLGVVEDYGLIVAGIIGTTMILIRNRKEQSQIPD